MEATTARSYPRHTHDQFGLGLVIDGRHASWSGLGHVEAGAGDFISVNPGEVHDGHAVSGRRSWRILYFEPAVLKKIRGDIKECPATDFEFESPAFSQPELQECFNRAYALTAAACHGHGHMEAETRLVELFAGLSVLPLGRGVQAALCRPQIRCAKQLIDDAPDLPWSLSELANAAGLSRYQLIRGFARELGLTPHSYIVQRRLEIARRLVRAGRALAEVALTTGFSDQSHLTRQFLRQYGVTPHQYRLATR